MYYMKKSYSPTFLASILLSFLIILLLEMEEFLKNDMEVSEP